MAVIIYEDVIPSLIENTTMIKVIRDGVPMVYRISPASGYVLRDKAGNWTDPDTNVAYDAYYTGICSCGVDYDFENNPREFYAAREESVPKEQVFGGAR